MRQLPSSFAVALGLCFILPLLNYFRDPPIGDFFGEWSSAVAMALGALFMVGSLPRSLRVSGALLVLPVLLAALILLQGALGRYVYLTDAFLYICYLGMFVLVVLLGQHFRSDGMAVEVTRRMAWAVVLVGLVNFAAQIAQLGRWDLQLQPWVVRLPGESVCALYGNTGQSNQTSAIAWLALAGTLYLANERRMPAWLMPVMVLLFMTSSALTVSRMAWLFVALCAVGMLVTRPRWVGTFGGRLALAVGLVAAFAVVTVGVSALVGAIDPSCKSSVARLAEGQEAGISARLDYLRQAVLVWMHNPLIGSGAASLNGMAYRLIADDRPQPIDQYAHNIVAQLLGEFGLIGVLGLLIVVGVCAVAVWRNRKELGAADALLLGWLGVIGIHSLLEYPLWYVHFLMFFGLTLGLVIRPQWRVLAIEVPARLLVGLISVAALAVCGFLFNDYRNLDRLLFLAMEKVDKQIGSSPQVDALLAGVDEEILIFRPQADHMMGFAFSMTRDNLPEKIALLDRLLSRSPTPQSIASRAVLAVLDGKTDVARWHLQRLEMFFPRASMELVPKLRALAAQRPDDLGPLTKLLDAMGQAKSSDARTEDQSVLSQFG